MKNIDQRRRNKMITDITRFQVLMEEIAYLKTKIQPHDTGHIYTTISTLEDRVEELKERMEPQLDNRQGTLFG